MSEDYEGEDRRDERFHLKREVTLGHVITTIILFGAIIGIYEDNKGHHAMADKRISIIEIQMESTQEQLKSFKTTMSNRLSSIDSKLDRLIERMLDDKR